MYTFAKSIVKQTLFVNIIESVMKIANNIKAVAMEHGKSVSQLANDMGVLQPQLSRTINNPRITLEDMSKLADVIGCSVGDFFREEKEGGCAVPSVRLSCPHCGKDVSVNVSIGNLEE